jgi:hypothetical protein
MKFTIMGFSQKKMVEYGLDLSDLLILRYIIDLKECPKIYYEAINDQLYYWIRYDRLLEYLPGLGFGKRQLSRKFKGLTDKGILKQYIKKENGTFSLYALGGLAYELLSKERNTSEEDFFGGDEIIDEPQEEILEEPQEEILEEPEGITEEIKEEIIEELKVAQEILKDKPKKRTVRVAAGYDELTTEKEKKPRKRKSTNHNSKPLNTWNVKDFLNYFNDRYNEKTNLGFRTFNRKEEEYLRTLISARDNNELIKDYMDTFIESNDFKTKDIYNFCLSKTQSKLDNQKIKIKKDNELDLTSDTARMILKLIKKGTYMGPDDCKYLKAVKDDPSILDQFNEEWFSIV